MESPQIKRTRAALLIAQAEVEILRVELREMLMFSHDHDCDLVECFAYRYDLRVDEDDEEESPFDRRKGYRASQNMPDL